MLSFPVYAHYQDYILLSQLTWTNCQTIFRIKKYIENARQKETDMLEKQKSVMEKINWL